jgi:hypothetical protein
MGRASPATWCRSRGMAIGSARAAYFVGFRHTIEMKPENLYATSFASVYPYYVKKAEAKGRTKDELDEIIRWLTGYTQPDLEKQITGRTDFRTFYENSPNFNQNASLIKGVVCGIRVEDIEDPLMQKIRYLDKLIDELAKGKKMEKILRSPE